PPGSADRRPGPARTRPQVEPNGWRTVVSDTGSSLLDGGSRITPAAVPCQAGRVFRPPRGRSSAGRALASQAKGRGFETRRPLLLADPADRTELAPPHAHARFPRAAAVGDVPALLR